MANTKNTKRILLTVGISVAAVALVLCILAGAFFGVLLLRENQVPLYPSGATATIDSFHTELQSGFLNDKYYWHISPYSKGVAELSRPRALTIDWDADSISEAYCVRISEHEDMSDYSSYCFEANAATEIYNLKLGTTYYCMVYDPEGSPISSRQILTTDAQAPRNMYVDGVTNVRDLGGWSIPCGKVKQGLIYRCGRLNENKQETPVAKITEKGIDTMLNEMNIRSEIDLRKTSDNEVGGLTDKSILGDSVNYYQCPMGYNGNMLTNNRDMIRHIFADVLSKEENYPLIFHCSIGTDRTGLVAFLINGLLGVDINDLYRDYLFSNFGDIGGDRDVLDITFNYVTTIYNTKGDTWSQKIENYLLSIGVTQDEIDSVRRILSERA